MPPGLRIEPRQVRPGDAILLSGDIGRHAALAPAPKGGPAGPGVVATAPPQPAGPLEPPGPPPIPLKFIGIARQGQGRLLAVLRDERGIYYGAEGDVVEGRYRILRVSVELVEMAYLDGRGRTSIPLSGGRP